MTTRRRPDEHDHEGRPLWRLRARTWSDQTCLWTDASSWSSEPKPTTRARAHRKLSASFARVREMGANTVLAAVAWDLFEPEEGLFDTTLIDEMLAACRREGLRLIPLWFGAWKNGQSTYAPAWVKTNIDRFPRAEIGDEGPVEHLSPFGVGNGHSRRGGVPGADGASAGGGSGGTVVMVQVENEVGLLGDSRDRSALADRDWSESVPAAVLAAISAAASPPRARGMGRRRIARDRVMGRGIRRLTHSPRSLHGTRLRPPHRDRRRSRPRRVRDSPLRQRMAEQPTGVGFARSGRASREPEEPVVTMAGGAQPGTYPSGGPLPRVAPIWTAPAPSLDFLAPDIYFGDPDTIFDEFRRVASRLFIPEMRRSHRRSRADVPRDRRVRSHRRVTLRRRLAGCWRPRGRSRSETPTRC